MRPPGRGSGLDGPVCLERQDLEQGNPPGLIGQKLCVRCGRVTARVDDDGVAWCGGSRHATAADNTPRYRWTRQQTGV